MVVQRSNSKRTSGETQTTKNQKEKTMQFIWCYWLEGAKEDELRWSIRSVNHHFPDAKITVIGDQAPWYFGHLINKPKIPLVWNHNLSDVISKLEVIVDHPKVDDEFIFMM